MKCFVLLFSLLFLFFLDLPGLLFAFQYPQETPRVESVNKEATNTLVLAYQDFGPQVIAYELLGMEWYQWRCASCGKPDDKFDIKVVVYRDISLSDAMALYPTIENKADYRHVEYARALQFIDKQISELQEGMKTEEDKTMFTDLIRLFRDTRSKITLGLGD
jgi:hypothetical protein